MLVAVDGRGVGVIALADGVRDTAAAAVAAGVFAPAFGLVLRPEIAALSMSGSSLIVAVNALLLKRLTLPARVPAAPPATQPGTVAGSGRAPMSE